MSGYPATAAARDRFVLDRRPPRAAHDPWRAQGVVVEDERSADGVIARVATVFITGRECPWRCLMCDLWKYTTESDTPGGAIPRQIEDARRQFAGQSQAIDQIKLYNAGSLFDPRAVPESDYDAIADGLSGLSRIIVESHPSLVGERTKRFRDALRSRVSTSVTLEVAMGLETTHPAALDRLNKRMTVDDFSRAAERLAALDVALRVFLLVHPPFVPEGERDDWLRRSIDTAFGCGATAVSLIPTRTGNGALDALAGCDFRQPQLTELERSFETNLERAKARGGRLFVDLWDLDRFSECDSCLDARRDRLRAMNLEQRLVPAIPCDVCAGSTFPHRATSAMGRNDPS